jgi:N6-adenosine-specific RNA methylase IME4
MNSTTERGISQYEGDENHSLIQLDEARRILSQINTIDEVKDVRDKAEAMRVYAKQAKLGLDAQNHAAEIKIRAERRAGELLKEMDKHPAGRPPKEGKISDIVSPIPTPPTLSELGISNKQSSRWQALAGIPEEKFEAALESKKAEGQEEITSVNFQRMAMEERRKDLASRYTNSPEMPKDKYRVIYADPPWKYGNTMPEYFGEQADHYPLMTIPEICSMPIKELAQDNAVLFLWVTSPILAESFQVIEAWGFEYKSSFVWDKIGHVMGHYNSVRHELLLICTRGSCTPDVQKLFDSVVSIERTAHSEKPEFFREIIDTIYPLGNRIELFARKSAENWEAYGNELSALVS